MREIEDYEEARAEWHGVLVEPPIDPDLKRDEKIQEELDLGSTD